MFNSTIQTLTALDPMEKYLSKLSARHHGMQVQQGKPEVQIKTNRIWGSGQHASCYHEFTVEDHTCSADTLEFTIEASFQTQGERDAADILFN